MYDLPPVSFQDDKDLVHEFVVAEGFTCLIKVGAEADQNYQNYILRGTSPPPLSHTSVYNGQHIEDVIHQRCHTSLPINPSRTTCVYVRHVN